MPKAIELTLGEVFVNSLLQSLRFDQSGPSIPPQKDTSTTMNLPSHPSNSINTFVQQLEKDRRAQETRPDTEQGTSESRRLHIMEKELKRIRTR
ncbi:putative kelch-like protein 24 [Sesbania bispinosa]|nr:putative kelch-like protein 24 [Sesbania bispinosa]